MISWGRPNTRDTSRHLNFSIVRYRPRPAAHRLVLSDRSRCIADSRSQCRFRVLLAVAVSLSAPGVRTAGCLGRSENSTDYPTPFGDQEAFGNGPRMRNGEPEVESSLDAARGEQGIQTSIRPAWPMGPVSTKPRFFRRSNLSGLRCFGRPGLCPFSSDSPVIDSKTFRYSIQLRKVLARNKRNQAPRNFLGFGLTTPISD